MGYHIVSYTFLLHKKAWIAFIAQNCYTLNNKIMIKGVDINAIDIEGNTFGR